MSIELIKEKHGSEVNYCFSQTKEEIKIISPFLGENTCKRLSELVLTKNIKCQIITRFCREDFIRRANSLDGLEHLINCGVQAFALKHLHSKLYLFDADIAIITSANFTYGGLVSNFELGIKVDNEDNIIDECNNYFMDLWNRIEEYNIENPQKSGKITLSMIDDERNMINKFINSRDQKAINLPNNFIQGADLAISTTKDFIENILNEKNVIDERIIGGWIKFEADADNRQDGNEKYFDFKKGYTKDKTFFPKRPRSIEHLHKIYIAVVSYDRHGHEVPIIVGRTFSLGFELNNKIEKNNTGWENWMEQYPYYIQLKNGEFFDGPIKEGIPMYEIYKDIGNKTFPNTYNMELITFEELRQRHYRRDKIRITVDVEKYLDRKLEILFKKYGVKEI